MSLQIVETNGPTFLIVDTQDIELPVIDAYPTIEGAQNFLEFIGQVPPDLDPNHGEECAMCGCPLYTDTPGLCGGCKHQP